MADEIEAQIKQFAATLTVEVATFLRSPAFEESSWQGDFKNAMYTATKIVAPGRSLSKTESAIVASAARIADLMAAERKSRRASAPVLSIAGTETTQ